MQMAFETGFYCKTAALFLCIVYHFVAVVSLLTVETQTLNDLDPLNAPH